MINPWYCSVSKLQDCPGNLESAIEELQEKLVYLSPVPNISYNRIAQLPVRYD